MRVFILETSEPDFINVVTGDILAFGLGLPRSSRPKATLRSTVAQGISAKSWNTKARSGPGALTVFHLSRWCPHRPYQPGDDLQQRGLAAAARAQQAGQFAPRKVEVDTAQRLHAPVVLGDSPHLHNRIGWRWAGDGPFRNTAARIVRLLVSRA